MNRTLIALLACLGSGCQAGSDDTNRLVDCAVESGIDFRHERGASGELRLYETMGGGAAWLDYDGDGDAPRLLRAEGRRRHYLLVDLVGEGPGGRDAVGARVDVWTAKGRQTRWRFGGGSYLSSGDAPLHFGLGQETRVKRLEVDLHIEMAGIGDDGIVLHHGKVLRT